MSIQLAQAIVVFMGLYAAAGVLVASIIVFFTSGRIDRVAANSTAGFRLIILPGAILLWPLLLRRALIGRGEPPLERNAHRNRALPS